MEPLPSSEHLCYVRCNYCNTVLAVGVPCKRLMDTVTVKCGHCNNLSFLSTRPLGQISHVPHHDFHFELASPQAHCHDFMKSHSGSHASSSSPSPQAEQKAPFVVKPPERKHRVPSAYNRFMKEEIQRIKAAEPDIPHREAFSMAAKNWAKCDPHTSRGSPSENHKNMRKMASQQHDASNSLVIEGLDSVKQL